MSAHLINIRQIVMLVASRSAGDSCKCSNSIVNSITPTHFVTGQTLLELGEILEVTSHVCRQHHVNDSLAHGTEVFATHRFEDIDTGLFERQLERQCGMVIFQDGNVVVEESEGVSRVDEKRISAPRMIEIVNRGSNKRRHRVNLLNVALDAHILF